jgi:PAS domain S-box-containing protein
MTIVHPEDGPEIERKMLHSLETGEPYEAEFRVIRPGGEIRTIFERAECYSPDGSSDYRLRGVLQDITERKAFEEELRETAERLAKSQSAGKIGSWVWEIPEDREWWSDEVYKMYGMDVGQVIMGGYDFLEYVHPGDQAQVRAALERSISEGAPYTGEYRLRRVDGREIILSEHGEMEYDADGKPVRMRGTVQDITERKMAEIALQRTMERLEEAQSLGQMGSFTWNPATDTTWWSHELYRIFGLEPGSRTLNGWTFMDYVHPDDRARVRKIEEQAVAKSHPYSVEYRIIRPDGSHRTVYEQCERIEHGVSGEAEWRGVVQDITERKRIEDELARLNAELEQRVEERTAELRAAQEELVKRERLATLGQLTATVSHELRNPLGAMRTSMYVIDKKAVEADQSLRTAIDRVARNITRCDQIIDELLDFTRIRDLEPRPTNLDNWLTALLDEQTVPESVTVERKLATKGIRVPADTDRLRRAFINVFENACQAASAAGPDGKPNVAAKVDIATRVSGERIEITVSDNGPGIPAELREKIFEPLFSTKSFGVGLGLPTVRQIMEQHGGGVEIGSRRGGGAVFALWLPATTESESADA